MNAKEIGDIIHKRRKYLKLTQQDLADFSEININTVVAIEKGEGNPKIETLAEVANVLGMEMIIKMKD